MTTSLQTRTFLRDLLIEQLACEAHAVVPSATLRDLGADSLDLVEIVMRLEQELLIDISDKDVASLEKQGGDITVQQILDYLQTRTA